MVGIKSNETDDTASDSKPIVFDSISPAVIPEVEARAGRGDPSPDMQKAPDLDDDLRPHYDFDYTKVKPNRFAVAKKVYKESSIPTKTSRSLRATRRRDSPPGTPRSLNGTLQRFPSLRDVSNAKDKEERTDDDKTHAGGLSGGDWLDRQRRDCETVRRLPRG
jgi:hypothetical protein